MARVCEGENGMERGRAGSTTDGVGGTIELSDANESSEVGVCDVEFSAACCVAREGNTATEG